jgi:hypothetical protein
LKFTAHYWNTAGLLLIWAVAFGAQAESREAYHPEALLGEVASFPHALPIARKVETARDHEIGLGPIQKLKGDWVFRSSVRLDGELQRVTWQIVDGFASRELLQRLEASLMQQGEALLLFACDGRSCGSGSQWANRVFGQRLLYGRADDQSYRVYALDGPHGGYRVLLYSGARSADRQYLHAEILTLAVGATDSAL